MRAGKYFGNYFIMGGERFETNQQDVYLFGENDDLNFLGSKPVPVSIIFTYLVNLLCYFCIVRPIIVNVFVFCCILMNLGLTSCGVLFLTVLCSL